MEQAGRIYKTPITNPNTLRLAVASTCIKLDPEHDARRNAADRRPGPSHKYNLIQTDFSHLRFSLRQPRNTD
jgi:hypothetical protein